MKTKILTYDTRKGKQILAGSVDDLTHTFIKKVTSKHFFKKTQSYAIQETVIEQLKELGITTIKIITPASIYMSTLDIWLDPCIKVLDYGHGKQRFLPIKYMRRIPK